MKQTSRPLSFYRDLLPKSRSGWWVSLEGKANPKLRWEQVGYAYRMTEDGRHIWCHPRSRYLPRAIHEPLYQEDGKRAFAITETIGNEFSAKQAGECARMLKWLSEVAKRKFHVQPLKQVDLPL